MIKFFGRIRQRILTENKFGKYLLYAIGEILLVFIGIMIALYVNNKNQESAYEEEIKATLIEIQRDITSDIGYSIYYLGEYMERDSLKNLVMNNKVSYDDIKSKRVNAFSLAYWSYPMMLRTNGYKQFNNKIDMMPENYKALIKDLNFFYGQMGSNVEHLYDLFVQTGQSNLDESFHQFAWLGQDQFNDSISDEQIDFYLRDQKFKSYAMHMNHRAKLLAQFTTRYRTRAIEIYFKIDEILDGEGMKTPDHIRNTTLADSMHAESLVGYYKQISGPEQSQFGKSIKITALGKQLYLNTEKDEKILLHYAHPEKMHFYIYFTSTILKFNPNENDDLTIISGGTDERRWKKVISSSE